LKRPVDSSTSPGEQVSQHEDQHPLADRRVDRSFWPVDGKSQIAESYSVDSVAKRSNIEEERNKENQEEEIDSIFPILVLDPTPRCGFADGKSMR